MCYELASANTKFSSKMLTCALPNIRSLNHSGARCSLAKGDLIYDGIFFNNGTTLNAEAVSSCGIVFNDSSSTITAHDLRTSKHNPWAIDDEVAYHCSR